MNRGPGVGSNYQQPDPAWGGWSIGLVLEEVEMLVLTAVCGWVGRRKRYDRLGFLKAQAYSWPCEADEHSRSMDCPWASWGTLRPREPSQSLSLTQADPGERAR